jgi:ABC-2 type transport system permease protein
VLAKASVAIVILPLVTFAVTFAVQLIMALLSTMVLLGSGMSAAMLWTHFLEMSVMLLYHLIAIHGLSFAPIYAWMLLVSAWARRTPFLWAFLPFLVLSIGEKIAFNSWHFAHMLGYVVGGGKEGDAFMASSKSMAPLSMISPFHFLISPGLWIGLAIAAAFLAAAVRLRRYQGPI